MKLTGYLIRQKVTGEKKGSITMNKTFSDKNNGLDYTLVGEVYLPNLISTETNYEIGHWGQRHLDYIK